ncbi:Poly [ADP-ribose] polymerase tankyrase, partial [Gryllus bimaculatus]
EEEEAAGGVPGGVEALVEAAVARRATQFGGGAGAGAWRRPAGGGGRALALDALPPQARNALRNKSAGRARIGWGRAPPVPVAAWRAAAGPEEGEAAARTRAPSLRGADAKAPGTGAGGLHDELELGAQRPPPSLEAASLEGRMGGWSRRLQPRPCKNPCSRAVTRLLAAARAARTRPPRPRPPPRGSPAAGARRRKETCGDIRLSCRDEAPVRMTVVGPGARASWYALRRAAECGNTEAVRALLDSGADVHARDIFDATALHCAAENGHSATVQLLLRRGAHAGCKNHSGWSPLHAAARWGHPQCFALLLAAGADLESRDKWGRTPLHVAAQWGREAAARALLAAGASPSACDSRRQTPLHLAASDGVRRLLQQHTRRALCNNSLDQNATAMVVLTPVMKKCFEGQDVVQLFVGPSSCAPLKLEIKAD